MKVLITGFEPFGGEKINPSSEIVKALPDTLAGAEITKLEVPTVYGKAAGIVLGKIKETAPDIVIMLGQAGGRASVSVERIGINVNDSAAPDNSGQKIENAPIVPGGPAAYFSTLPIRDIVAGLKETGVPAVISNSAGTYVCNSLFYGTMHGLSSEKRPAAAGFIHIPYLTSQVLDRNLPSMSFETMLKGIEKAVEIAVRKLGG